MGYSAYKTPWRWFFFHLDWVKNVMSSVHHTRHVLVLYLSVYSRMYCIKHLRTYATRFYTVTRHCHKWQFESHQYRDFKTSINTNSLRLGNKFTKHLVYFQLVIYLQCMKTRVKYPIYNAQILSSLPVLFRYNFNTFT